MDHFFFFKRKKEAQRVTQNSAVWTLRSLNLKWTNFLSHSSYNSAVCMWTQRSNFGPILWTQHETLNLKWSNLLSLSYYNNSAMWGLGV